ncbi:ankyrin repeat-containing domain protein, partial [Trichophaea hybrida]
MSTLLLAAKTGWYLVVEKLILTDNKNLLGRDTDGNSALHLAARSGFQDVVELLLKWGLDPLSTNNAGHTPLHLAILNGREQATKLLLNVTDLSPLSDSEWHPFHAAAATGSLHLVQLLTERQWGDPSHQNDAGETALHIAARKGHVDMISWLLNRGVNLDVRNKFHQTALFLAASEGKDMVVSMLLNKGADPNIGDSNNHIPLHAAVLDLSVETVKAFLDRGVDIKSNGENGRGVLHHYTMIEEDDERKTTMFQLLFDSEALVDCKDDDGETPLFAASFSESNIWFAKQLIERGADVNTRDYRHSTPLHQAAGGKNDALVEILLSNGAKADSRDDNERTPLHHAAEYARFDALANMKALVDAGSDPTATDHHGNSPLHLAVRGEDELRAKFLLDICGVNVNARNHSNETPLHRCTKVENVRVLLSRGVDIDAQDNYGRTALHICVKSFPAIVPLLVKNGCDVNLLDHIGFTALHYSA